MSLNKLSADICLKRCTSLYIAEQDSLLPQCYCFLPGSIFWTRGSVAGHITPSVLQRWLKQQLDTLLYYGLLIKGRWQISYFWCWDFFLLNLYVGTFLTDWPSLFIFVCFVSQDKTHTWSWSQIIELFELLIIDWNLLLFKVHWNFITFLNFL